MSIYRNSLNLVSEKYFKYISSSKLVLAKIKKTFLKTFSQKLILAKINSYK